jgi:hypothetical protein
VSVVESRLSTINSSYNRTEQGFGITGTNSNISINNCTFQDNYYGVRFSGQSSLLEIVNSTIRNNLSGIEITSGGGVVAPTILRNTITNQVYDGISLRYSTNGSGKATIQDNNIRDNGGDAIVLTFSVTFVQPDAKAWKVA